jgi:lipoprotein-releasing system permease protein
VAGKRKERFFGVEWLIAGRMIASRKRSYVALVSSISTWGLALGVASLISIFSVTTGFEEVFRERLLGVYPHLIVIGRGGDLPDWERVLRELGGSPHIRSVSPATYDEMMASCGGRRAGSLVKGVAAGDPTVAAVVAPLLAEGRVSDLSIEPAFALERDRLTIGAVPGGTAYVAAVLPEGRVLSATSFDEAEEIPRLRLLSALPRPVRAEVAGVLMTQEETLDPGELSRAMEIPEGETKLVLDGIEHWVEASPGNQIFVLVPRGERVEAVRCPTPPPGPGGDPSQLCLLNLGASQLHVDLPSGSIRLSPGESRTVTETQVARPTVILGEELARRIEARVGDEIRLVSPLFSVPGLSLGRKKGRTIADTFKVVGIVSLGFYEYDSKLALVDWAVARRFLHQGDVARWVEVRVDDLFASEARKLEVGRQLAHFSLLNVAEHAPLLLEKYATEGLAEPEGATDLLLNISNFLKSVRFSNVRGELAFGFEDNYRVVTWEEMNSPLFTSMKRQRIVLSLFFLIIIIVAAFNIVTSQIMIIREKTPEIAILKAMGANYRQVKRIFLGTGMAVGLVGTAAGIAIAVAACVLLDRVGFPLDPKVYFVSQLPVALRIEDIVAASAFSLLSIFIAVSIAARRAAEKSPVEGLRELE